MKGSASASTSICFDLSIFELFLPLSWGGTVPPGGRPLELPEWADKDAVKLVNTVPSAMTELLRMGGVPASVRVVNLAGEALQRSLVEGIYRQTKGEAGGESLHWAIGRHDLLHLRRARERGAEGWCCDRGADSEHGSVCAG